MIRRVRIIRPAAHRRCSPPPIRFSWTLLRTLQRSSPRSCGRRLVSNCTGIIPWVAIVIYVWAPGLSASPPGFVYGIIVSLFVFFNCFAVNMVLQYKKVGRWRDYLFGEKVYIILSLTAKALLAWQVFFPVLATTGQH